MRASQARADGRGAMEVTRAGRDGRGIRSWLAAMSAAPFGHNYFRVADHPPGASALTDDCTPRAL
jgi:hypothetical protein